MGKQTHFQAKWGLFHIYPPTARFHIIAMVARKIDHTPFQTIGAVLWKGLCCGDIRGFGEICATIHPLIYKLIFGNIRSVYMETVVLRGWGIEALKFGI